VLAATALAFARALGDFGVTIMIAGNIPGKTQTASVAIYDAVQAGRDNEAFTLAVTVSVIAGFMLYLINRFEEWDGERISDLRSQISKSYFHFRYAMN
jgi:molybdate transport system permease protein